MTHMTDTHQRARKAERGTRGWWNRDPVVVIEVLDMGVTIHVMRKDGYRFDAPVFGLLLANEDEQHHFDGWADVDHLPEY